MSTTKPESVSVDALVERFPSLSDESIDFFIEMAGAATLYEGSVESDFSDLIGLANEEGEEGTIIVVDGDLTLTAPVVEWGNDESNNLLLVTGRLTARGLSLSEIGCIKVLGDVKVVAISGRYGDNGGSVDFGGDLEADYIMAETYFCFGIGGKVRAKGIIGDGTYATDFANPDDVISTEDINLFVPEVCDGDEVSAELLVARAVEGLPVFVNGGKPRDGVYEEEM